jgi:cytochrome c-type biogenesis protein CcmE
VDPQRKRKIRLVVALSAAVLLAVALVYTSFSASSEARQPSELVNAAPGGSY